jgi:PAS domain S-box-containing protein
MSYFLKESEMQSDHFVQTSINLESVLDSVPGYVYWKDSNLVYLGCNQNVSDLIGLANSREIIGKSDCDFPWGKESQLILKSREDDQYVLSTGQMLVTEDRLGIKNKKNLEIILRTEKTPLFDKKGGIVGILGIGVDITLQKYEEQQKIERAVEQEIILSEKIFHDRKHIHLHLQSVISEVTGPIFSEGISDQQHLDEIRNCLESIVLQMPGYVYWKDKNFKYLFCNEPMANFFGFSSPDELIGRTDYDLGWSNTLVDEYRKVDEEIIKTGQARLGIQEVVRNHNGKFLCLNVNKMPFFNKKGDIIGIVGVSVDITAQKDAERVQREAEKLQHENEIRKQRLIIEENKKLIALAHTVAHDISSPLSALSMMMHLCDELKENKRSVIKRATESILDIANDLLSTYRNEATSNIELRQPVLVSDLIDQLLSEKKIQYSNHAIRFETKIASDTQFAFAQLQAGQFRRSLSNLINNAVDASASRDDGLITIKVTADAQSVGVAIQDNGKGMSSGLIEKMLDRQNFTHGKVQGHGLGLQQVWSTLDYNQGKIDVDSILGKGTTIQLTFPRVDAVTWIAQTIHIALNSIVVILDDEDSIHGDWDTRFAFCLKSYPNLNVHHFTQGQEVLNFFSDLSRRERKRVVYLSDYELLHQNKNGLQIIEESGIKNATLVTSYDPNSSLRDKVVSLGLKILPKHMATSVPIKVDMDAMTAPF